VRPLFMQIVKNIIFAFYIKNTDFFILFAYISRVSKLKF